MDNITTALEFAEMLKTQSADDLFVLKPCPFCGGEPTVQRSVACGQVWWWIRCGICGCETKAEKDVTGMVRLWNLRRSAEPPKPDRHVCMTCKWRSDEMTSVCVNDESEHLSDFVESDGTCELWEGKTDA